MTPDQQMADDLTAIRKLLEELADVLRPLAKRPTGLLGRKGR
jgi:hypothetical protein